MTRPISDRIWSLLICPFCGADLEKIDRGARCTSCDTTYPYNELGQLDLRPQRAKSVTNTSTILPAEPMHRRIEQVNTAAHPQPAVDFSQMKVPKRFDAELLRYFPAAQSRESLMLDVGCGTGLHREIGEKAGFQYVGIDYASPAADLLADAQALPFKDHVFEFILAMAVMQYLQHPNVMVQEARRVLKPGCPFMGSAGFLEPYDGTFFHHTHKAVLSILIANDFAVDYLVPNPRWHFLTANAWMLFPKMPVKLARLIVSPLLGLHRAWWWIGSHLSSDERANETFRRLATTGAIRFVATSPRDSQ